MGCNVNVMSDDVGKSKNEKKENVPSYAKFVIAGLGG